MEQHKHGKRVIQSSKRSTYDPRKNKEANRKKTYAIRKRYNKLKEKIGEIKTYDIESLQTEKPNQKRIVTTEEVMPEGEGAQKGKATSRTKQRKKMFKKTRSGQPVMKYRIEKILETIK